MVSWNQTAFIRSRNIVGNMLVAPELVKNYHSGKGIARCTIKVDLIQAYDSIHQDFVINYLLAIDIRTIVIEWIKECISYYEIVNLIT